MSDDDDIELLLSSGDELDAQKASPKQTKSADTVEDAASGSDDGEDEEIEGDAEYELTREEGTPVSAGRWKVTFMKTDFPDDLIAEIRKMKPFKRCETTARIVPTKSYQNLIEGFCLFLDCGKKVPPKVMKTLCLEVFGCCDIFYGIIRHLASTLKKFTAVPTWWNVYNFMRFVPDPNKKIIPRLFQVKYHHLRAHSKRKLIGSYQDVWIELMKCEIPTNLLMVMIPYITDNVLETLREPHRTSDFFFKTFDRGDMYAILSLAAIFKLIVNHNFEYPNFYDHVYSLTKSSVLYLEQKKKFFDLLNTFLTSTHIPIYIVAGFAKRLCRLLLLAPLDAQEPLLGLIRNLVTRFPILTPLIHKELPETVAEDPFKPEEPALSKCGGIDSSLWEIKTLQQHWSSGVSKRAKFVDTGLQKLESFVRFRCQDEIFSNLMAKRYGKSLDSVEEKYCNEQDGSDAEEPAAKKPKADTTNKFKKGGKFHKKHERKITRDIPTNFTVPSGTFFPENSFNFEYDKFWAV